jgi:hypothetical protein
MMCVYLLQYRATSDGGYTNIDKEKEGYNATTCPSNVISVQISKSELVLVN